MSQLTTIKKIDMYKKSKREKNTRLCRVYATERAIEWLGNNSYHECDESCDHNNACSKCIHSYEDVIFGEISFCCKLQE